MSKIASYLLTLVLLTSSLLLITQLVAASAEPSEIPPFLLAPTPSVEATTTPTPTPIPTTKIIPGSPLVFGNQFFTEMISQFDITKVAEIVLVFLAVVWVIVILVYVDHEFIHKSSKNQERST